jgi:predicted Rossmann fold nucleotide-binding protein DprA/Smf involved in DNA uptake
MFTPESSPRDGPEMLTISQDDPRYPASLRTHLNGRAPASLAALGNPGLLRRRTLALFCSVRCPGDLILQAHDLVQNLRPGNLTVISGFHTPVERACLAVLLRGTQPVILCPARSMEKMRIRKGYRGPLQEGHLLFLSPFPEKKRRITSDTSLARNRFVAALADAILVVHAEPGGKTEGLCHEALAWRKPLYALAGDANAHLLALGAKPVRPCDINIL